MQEGMPALGQMAETVLARRVLTAAGLPFVAYLADPTTGGVYASFASLADVMWAEPGATIGFAGPRVAEQVAPLPTARTPLSSRSTPGSSTTCSRPKSSARRPACSCSRRSSPRSRLFRCGHRSPRAVLAGWDVVELARQHGRPWPRDPRRDLGGVRRLRGDRAGVDDAGLATGVARIAGRRAGVIALDRTRPTPPAYRKAFVRSASAGRSGSPRHDHRHARAPILLGLGGAGIAGDIDGFRRCWSARPFGRRRYRRGRQRRRSRVRSLRSDPRVRDAIFSVIAPESAAEILRRDDVEEVAGDLRLSARDLVSFGLADEVIPEPTGGAHTDPEAFVRSIGEAVGRSLDQLAALPRDERLAARRRRWREAGNAFLAP